MNDLFITFCWGISSEPSTKTPMPDGGFWRISSMRCMDFRPFIDCKQDLFWAIFAKFPKICFRIQFPEILQKLPKELQSLQKKVGLPGASGFVPTKYW